MKLPEMVYGDNCLTVSFEGSESRLIVGLDSVCYLVFTSVCVEESLPCRRIRPLTNLVRFD